MADTREHQLNSSTPSTTLGTADYVRVVKDVATTPFSANMTMPSFLTATSIVGGGMINGKLSPTVSSSNLKLAIKTLAGNDPSTTEPVYVMINGTIRSITSALSVTVNAGTNTFNAGAVEFATYVIDYFAYLSWRSASSAVVLGFARIPYARLYSDFSGTATAELYGAFSTAPASTDDVVVVGRFAATNSGTASYNWSVPSYTSVNLIHRPIFETRRLTYAPQPSASASMTYGTLTQQEGSYVLSGSRVIGDTKLEGTTGGTASHTLKSSMPFAQSISLISCNGSTRDATSGLAVVGSGFIDTLINCRKYDSSNYGLGTGRLMTVHFDYYIP